MTKNEIDRLGYLLSLTKEIEELKEKARAEGPGALVGEAYVVTVGKPRKLSSRLDTKTWKANAPKEYADVFRRYHTAESTGAASVSAAEIN